jgi:hypothetical protein
MTGAENLKASLLQRKRGVARPRHRKGLERLSAQSLLTESRYYLGYLPTHFFICSHVPGFIFSEPGALDDAC